MKFKFLAFVALAGSIQAASKLDKYLPDFVTSDHKAQIVEKMDRIGSNLRPIVQKTDIRETEIGKFFYLDFSYSDAADLAAGFAFQLINDLFLYNGEECVFWVLDAASDTMNGFLILTEENRPVQAVISFAYSIHKGPIAYYTCIRMVGDYSMVVDFYNTFFLKQPRFWDTYVVQIVFWNIFFNWVDLVYEAISLLKAQEEREWTTIGEYIAKIISDVLFKSPLSYQWNYKNSDVLNEDWG